MEVEFNTWPANCQINLKKNCRNYTGAIEGKDIIKLGKTRT